MSNGANEFISNVRNTLYEISESGYRDFSMSLLPDIKNVLGVRLPNLRKLAAKIAKSEYWEDYLLSDTNDIFEENMLHGMVIGCVDVSANRRLELIKEFVPLIDNWSVCDSFCVSLKKLAKEKDVLSEFLQPYFSSEREFYVRFAVVMLLDYFNESEYIEHNLDILSNIKNDKYYVKMAVAWAVSIFFLTDSEKMKIFLQSDKLSDEVRIKSIDKICDSLRVSKEDKKFVRELKRKIKKEI